MCVRVSQTFSSVQRDATLTSASHPNAIWDDWKLFDLEEYSLKLSAPWDHQGNSIDSFGEEEKKESFFCPKSYQIVMSQLKHMKLDGWLGHLMSLGYVIFWWHFLTGESRKWEEPLKKKKEIQKIDQNCVIFRSGLQLPYHGWVMSLGGASLLT